MTPPDANSDWPCARLAAGDPDAWREAFERLHPWMLSLVERLTAGRADVVRDEVQVVLVDLLERWPEVTKSFIPPDDLTELPSRLRAFVGSIIKNDVISLLRRHRFIRITDYPYDDTFPEIALNNTDFDDDYYDIIELKIALESLPEGDRELIRLFFWEELTINEVAAQLETSKTTAHRRRVQIINELRRKLGVPTED